MLTQNSRTVLPNGEPMYYSHFDKVREDAVADLLRRRGLDVLMLGPRSAVDALVRDSYGCLMEVAEFKSYREPSKRALERGHFRIKVRKVLSGLDLARAQGVHFTLYLYFGDGAVYRLRVPFGPKWKTQVGGWKNPRPDSKYDTELCFEVPLDTAQRIGTLPVPIFKSYTGDRTQ